MAVKIIILRKVEEGKGKELSPLLLKLRSLAMAQPGYISGETLMNADDPEQYLVISTWSNMDYWNKWVESEERLKIQGQIDEVLGEKTYYQVYYNA
jgi:heme oxygenase (mycobilin-producing)